MTGLRYLVGQPDGSGDGWAFCDLGHRHWGRHGAAGLLVRSGTGVLTSVLLGQRAQETLHPHRWGIPGGALQRGESAEAAAFRETFEESTLERSHVTAPVESIVVDHGGWSYTTFVVDATDTCPGRILPADFETVAFQWRRVSARDRHDLVPGLFPVVARVCGT